MYENKLFQILTALVQMLFTRELPSRSPYVYLTSSFWGLRLKPAIFFGVLCAQPPHSQTALVVFKSVMRYRQSKLRQLWSLNKTQARRGRNSQLPDGVSHWHEQMCFSSNNLISGLHVAAPVTYVGLCNKTTSAWKTQHCMLSGSLVALPFSWSFCPRACRCWSL